MSKLATILNRIEPIHEEAVNQANNHLNQLTKPQGSLGKLEDIARQVAGITGEIMPDLDKKAVIVMAGDHGVCEEGISAFPAEVTPQMVFNFLSGGAAVNVLARHAGADVICVDMGVNADLEHPELVSRKVRKGTRNMARESAMTKEEAVQAIQAGAELVDELVEKGYRLFATGEMGIGNTTASAAILCALTGLDASIAVGRGTGIDDAKWLHKQAVVNKALAINGLGQGDVASADYALDVLTKVGGLEIAGLVGVILGAAKNRCPVVVDGFISSAAALVASRLAPLSASYMLASHLSQEQGHTKMLEAVGLSAMLQMDMRLGEGTGAVLVFNVIDAAGKIMKEMATFDSAGVSRG
ncbi:nicotinate-nucleotide--dimethylbenzimidazole phosphoribosyltransferase [Paenibacillus marchantiophytorum]|uniref:Nicotinate-nucleotide--dimethylbenzimidazole phosphoribosyltransferase n=1 Tax=Paenibacillus marchantiophytorum TaxID=1619310 RepID=A0ABQ1EQH2_9BACL|nr:nicotinate-nucleotide--dimethylbenzimidazole phosphoribosyltransferase [Paenibacillus marchantiophytorum]GFZ82238.1 nicotinate-nucleotide--dimethylbenzimidazole phosphoribosyltransferase [Paenibacillus marchantiophytorum]